MKDFGEYQSIVEHPSNHLIAHFRPRDAARRLDVVHFVPHAGVRSDQFLESRPSLIIIFTLQIAHHGSGV